jgi:hypothetical protein
MRELNNIKQNKNEMSFMVLGVMDEREADAFIYLGYGVIHAISEGVLTMIRGYKKASGMP